MSDISKKFDFSGLLDNVKTMINPTANTPNPSLDDAIGIKLAEISALAQQLGNAHAEQTRELGKLNKLLNGLYKDIETLRNPPAEEKTPEATTAASDTAESEK